MKKYVQRLTNNFTLFFIIFTFCTVFDSIIYYIVTIIFWLYFVFFKLLKNTPKFKFYFIDFIPICFLLVWVYGLVLGILFGNKAEYIISNFAGMTMYLFYFVLIANNISLEKIYKIILISGWANVVLSIILSFLIYYFFIEAEIVQNIPFLNNISIAGASTGQNRLFWGGLLSVFCILSIGITKIISNPKHTLAKNVMLNIQGILYIICSSFSLFFITASKGFLLGIIVLFLIISFRFLIIEKRTILTYGNIRKNKVLNSKVVVLLFLGFLFILITKSLEFDNIFEAIVDKDDVSNEVRYEQVNYILNETTFIGKGLGACLNSGYSRNTTTVEACYGFELTYLNLLHKFGFAAVFLYLSYIYCFVKSFQLLTANKMDVNLTCIPIGALMFTIPSIGNPMLFSPQSVLLHCLCLYFIRQILLTSQPLTTTQLYISQKNINTNIKKA